MAEELESSGALDELLSKIDAGEIELTGDGGLVPALVKASLERGLQAEMSAHLGYENGDRETKTGKGVRNYRNGSYGKSVDTEVGEIEVIMPRGREGSFTARLVPKGSRRLGGLDEMIISLYAGGMTVREIQWHLNQTIGTDLSATTISNITSAVLDAVVAMAAPSPRRVLPDHLPGRYPRENTRWWAGDQQGRSYWYRR